MATFIPEWQRASGRNLLVRRVLGTLDDSYVVRKPVTPKTWAPDFFLQHPEHGWLALALCDAPFSELDPSQLFESDGKVEFEKVLERFQKLGGIPIQLSQRLEKMVVMWSCSPEESRVLSSAYLSRFGVRLLSKEQFQKLGSTLVERLLAPLRPEEDELVLGHYFPEAEIPAVSTTRRDFHRDNAAQLAKFFLDTQQEWAVKLDLDLPQEQDETAKDFSVRLVNGVAGSGKTLIVLNRARLLAQMYPEQRILVLIHNTPIVADIKERLHRAYGGMPDNLEITTFYSWVWRQWKRVFHKSPRMPENPKQVPELVAHYRQEWPDLKISDTQLIDEIDYINASLVADESTYLEINRTGQGFSLRAKERTEVWAINEAVQKALAREGMRLWSAVPRDICFAEEPASMEKYHHILVDEAQFFAPSWFQVVKLAMNEGSLFLCADPNQGFMKSRLSWKSVGLDVAGRTKKLRRSYRTTQAILKTASAVIEDAIKEDQEDYLVPDFDGMEQGERPILIYTDTPQDAVDRLANEIAAIVEGGSITLSSILVIYGDKVNKSMLFKELGRKVGPDRVWWFNHKDQKKEPPHGYGREYLRLAYLETATGLEGGLVFLVGMESLLTEERQLDVSDEEYATKREQSARKLYMALTRAGQRITLITSQKVPDRIGHLFEIL